ncbi:hypothetical protein EZV62_011739 [Acer yangbiense]|uniref:Uncharacterized protein n=1 Tax=Acer yangbiense TaxID=1000413 RepID=A0A5C7I6J0_9ROSI|nr:hypothetical protein EZV62_011739 [Acer yangbiense]
MIGLLRLLVSMGLLPFTMILFRQMRAEIVFSGWVSSFYSYCLSLLSNCFEENWLSMVTVEVGAAHSRRFLSISQAKHIISRREREPFSASSSEPCFDQLKTIIMGFSQGATVLNQLVSELGFAEAKSARNVGLNSAGAYINERKVIERISKRLAEESRVIRFVLHGTPRQWCDSREAVDLENIPIEEVFENLKCTRAGLTSGDVKDRLDLFGYNKLEDKKVFVLYVSSIGKQNSEFLGIWGLCGILCHGSWKLQLSWLLLMHMEGYGHLNFESLKQLGSKKMSLDTKTPQEAWSSHKPSVSHLRVFGSIAYIKVPEARRTKLEDKGEKCILTKAFRSAELIPEEETREVATEPQIPRDQQTPQRGSPSPQRYDTPLPIERDFSDMMPRGTRSLEDLNVLQYLGFPQVNPTEVYIDNRSAIALAKNPVLRNGRWSEEDASGLVPGDIVSIKLRDIVLADARLLEGDPLKIDQVVTLHKCIHALAHSSYLFRVSDQREHAVPLKTFNVGSYWGISSGNQESWRWGLLRFNVQASCIICSNHGHLRLVQGAITKRMTAIEQMAGMDVLCNDKTGTLTQNKLTVDKNMIEGYVVIMAVRASRLENQDASDGAIVAMLSDPKEARGGIKETYFFLLFNLTDKRTALKYLDGAGKIQSKQRCTRAGDQLAIGKETGKRLGMGTNMYPSSALLDSTDAAHSASDIVLTELGLSVITNLCSVYHHTIRIVLSFPFKLNFYLFIAKNALKCLEVHPALVTVKPSPLPDSWKLSEIFATEVVLGSYLALMTVVFFYTANETNFFTKHFHARGWTGVIWLFNIVTYLALDPLKFAVRYALSGRAWGLLVNQRTAFTDKKDFGKGAREVAWAADQRSISGLQLTEMRRFTEKNTFGEINVMAEEAKRRAEISRPKEIDTGKVESFAKL